MNQINQIKKREINMSKNKILYEIDRLEIQNEIKGLRQCSWKITDESLYEIKEGKIYRQGKLFQKSTAQFFIQNKTDGKDQKRHPDK